MDAMQTRQRILGRIGAFREAFGMSESRFGLDVANDAHLISDIRAGRAVSIDMMDRIDRYMSGYGGTVGDIIEHDQSVGARKKPTHGDMDS